MSPRRPARTSRRAQARAWLRACRSDAHEILTLNPRTNRPRRQAMPRHSYYGLNGPALAHACTIGRLRHTLAELRQEALARTLVGLPADPDLDALIAIVEAEIEGVEG